MNKQVTLTSTNHPRLALWDPTVVKWRGRWWLYCLATEQTVDSSDFFRVPNHIRVFCSDDRQNWTDLGRALCPSTHAVPEVLCAASAIALGGQIHLFYSFNRSMKSEWLIDQGIGLASTHDGRRFKLSDSFALPPDPLRYPSNCMDPDTGQRLHAWRDPFVVHDEVCQTYHLFVCTGGFRWGVPPSIAVAVASDIEGPYRLLSPAAGAKLGPGNPAESLRELPFEELERVQVRKVGGEFHLTISCWERHVSPSFKAECRMRGWTIDDSTLYLFKSEHAQGPYELCATSPVLQDSSATGLYAAWLADDAHLQALAIDCAIGWDPTRFQLAIGSAERPLVFL